MSIGGKGIFKVSMVFSMLLLILVGATSAFGYPNMDDECNKFNFVFGVSEWRYDSYLGYWVLIDHIPADYVSDVQGDASVARWKSNLDVSAVITRQGERYELIPAFTDEGEVGFLPGAPSELILCGDSLPIPKGGTIRDPTVIPEFSVLTSLFALLGALFGFAIIRKYK